MRKYNKINNIIGWVLFLVALVVYTITLEPSVSLWDCGEFISAAYKLQVVHPPGAPFFLLVGNFFSNLAFGNPVNVGWAVNMLSAIASALTVLFTFWITTYFARKIRVAMGQNDHDDIVSKILIFGSGIIAALTLTFMDTFWFSAVESEVYALSSFFTALTFWAMLKWERVADTDPKADRWLVFIAYMIGLAIGTHLLNLLVIPTVAIMYYFKKYSYSRLGLVAAFGVGTGILLIIQKMLIPGMPWLAANLDYFAVNTMGMPFYTGAYIFFIIIIAALSYVIWYSIKNQKYFLNLAFVSLSFIIFGYSSYTMVVIRSAANPAIDMNNPEDLFNLLSYINREQYGDRPLANGPWFNSVPDNIETIKEEFASNENAGEYIKVRDKRDYTFPASEKTYFPRMGDMNKEGGDVGYRYWSGMNKVNEQINFQENQLQQMDPSSPQYAETAKTIQTLKAKKPTMGKNLKFFKDYQLRYMYLRYFLWNFVGRQNDNQADLNKLSEDGNWISGIAFIDNLLVGDQKYLPAELKNNKARNTYYFIPLILGVIGLVFQLKNSKSDFIAVLTLFFFTGIAIIVFLNQPPFEPRERDYSHVGSFQTFCIWVGLGVIGLATLLERKLNSKNAAFAAFGIALLGAPVLMATQNWDDHDRSKRYLGIDFAKNYLESVAPNAILFCNGDNDTYPLWYAQNVEGIRPDIRIINLALFPTDWYAGSLLRKVYDSEPFKLTISKDQLQSGAWDYLRAQQMPGIKQDAYYPLDKVVEFMLSNDEKNKLPVGDGSNANVLPVNNFIIEIDRNAVIRNKVIQLKDTSRLLDKMTFVYPNTGGMHKGHIVLMDLIAQNAKNGWERPIYFTATSGGERDLGLGDYLQLEGLTYRLVPIKSDGQGRMFADEIMYKNITETFKWFGIKEKANFFVDEKASYVPHSLRATTYELARKYTDLYLQQNSDSLARFTNEALSNKQKAVKLLDKLMLEVPEDKLPFNRPELKLYYALTYLDLGEIDKGSKMLKEVSNYCVRFGKFYKKQKGAYKDYGAYMISNLYNKIISEAINTAKTKGLKDVEAKLVQDQAELNKP